MTDIKERAKELLKSISPWPWKGDGGYYVFRNDGNGMVCDDMNKFRENEDQVCRIRGTGSYEPQDANEEFIRLAPEIISSLLGEIERKDKAIEDAIKLDDRINNAISKLEGSIESLTQEHKEGEE